MVTSASSRRRRVAADIPPATHRRSPLGCSDRVELTLGHRENHDFLGRRCLSRPTITTLISRHFEMRDTGLLPLRRGSQLLPAADISNADPWPLLRLGSWHSAQTTRRADGGDSRLVSKGKAEDHFVGSGIDVSCYQIGNLTGWPTVNPAISWAEPAAARISRISACSGRTWSGSAGSSM